jgi:hypothetical protein
MLLVGAPLMISRSRLAHLFMAAVFSGSVAHTRVVRPTKSPAS